MTTSENIIKKEIEAHLNDEGSTYNKWYIGISKDGKNRLKQHNVNLEKGKAWWIIREAINTDVSRRIEKYFIDLGCDGGDGGGDEDSTYVYAYKKISNTKP